MHHDTHQICYQAFEGFEPHLANELAEKNIKTSRLFPRLFLGEQGQLTDYVPLWAQNIWFNAKFLEFESVGKAAKHLKDIQRNWYPFFTLLPSRTELIRKKLPYIGAKKFDFLQAPKTSRLGAYALVSQNLLIYSDSCSSIFPNGEICFNEDREGPPNRAYLKLWEILSRIQDRPKQGERIMELGASPGGWTFSLADLSENIITFDRAHLDPKVREKCPKIDERIGDAFKATPDVIGEIDWLFSDLICYPDKLWKFVKLWKDSGKCKNIIVTIKFQGAESYSLAEPFFNDKESTILHLNYNKHECTYFFLESENKVFC